MWKTILDSIFPINCLGCNQEGEFICFNCFKKIPLNKKPPLNFNQKGALDNLITTSSYKHPLVKETVHQFKYNFIEDLAEPLGLLMVKKLNVILSPAVLRDEESRRKYILVPIPLHKKRLRWRGFNQADPLAQIVSQELNIPMNNNLLIRTKYTLPQVKIQNAEQRKKNMKEVFSINPNFEKPSTIQNKNIILIDDISTTGATLEECAQTLKPLQPNKIWGLVIAQG